MPAVVAKLKELGITEIEGGGGRSMDRAAFRKLAEENGLKIVATGGGFDNLQNKDSFRKSLPMQRHSVLNMSSAIGFHTMAITLRLLI